VAISPPPASSAPGAASGYTTSFFPWTVYK
jgi:hypothetical protein